MLFALPSLSPPSARLSVLCPGELFVRFVRRPEIDGSVWIGRGILDCLRVPFSKVSSQELDLESRMSENEAMNTKKKDWRSRPRKPRAEKRPHNIVLRLTDEELAEVVRLARQAGLSRSEFIRGKIFPDYLPETIAMP